ncbi:MAG: TonB-dependent receptor [Bacteroidota bacterium]
MNVYLSNLSGFSIKNAVFKLKLAIVLIVVSTYSFAQTGAVKGKVTTSDGKPAEFVNVGIIGTKMCTSTNKEGNYSIDNIQPGTYSLQVSLIGLEKVIQTLVVIADQTNVVDFSLIENSRQLQEVVVSVTKSNNEKPVNIGKINIKPLDLPQSIAFIDKETMEQQQTLRMSDALKNFNGVYLMGTSGGYQEEIAGRGFAFGSNNTFKNGVRFNNLAMPEMSALERIEVMKGSSAILFGNVAAGGVINLITKKPDFKKGGEITMQTGSYDFYKPSIDVYGAIDKNNRIAYRMNTTYEKSRSFRDLVNAERIYINPSFLIKLGKKTDFLIEGDYLKDNRTADFGVGAINYKLIDIPRNQFLGVAWSYIKTEQKSITSTITHHLNENWEIRSVTSYQQFNNDLFANQRPNGNSQFIRANGNWIRGLQRTKIDEEYSITQLDLTGRFNTWAIKHNLLFGADADQYYTNTYAYNAVNTYDSINVFDLGKYKQRNDIPDLTVKTTTSSPIKRAGVYVQDLIEITKQIKVLAGARFSYLETFSTVYTYSTKAVVETRQFDNAITPRFGLVYQPLKTMALFASYSNSFIPNKGVDIDNKALVPSFVNQYEVGIKNDLFKGLLSANLTVYQIINSNLVQTTLVNGNTNSNIKELAGEVTSKGLELDIMSKPYKGISVIAGYSYNDTRYTKSNTYIVGSKLLYNPANTANTSVYYSFSNSKILNGFNVGIGMLYIGDRVAGRSTRVTVLNDTYKPFALPNYSLLDASIGYAKNNISVRFKISNILNELSYNVHDDNSVNPIAPRQLAATFSYKF